MTLISAHRCGAGADVDRENTMEALQAALESDCDFVEFDVQRCNDGTLVLYHDDHVTVNGRTFPIGLVNFTDFAEKANHFLTLETCLAALKGSKKAHVDLKFVSPPRLYARPESTYESDAVRQIIDVMGHQNAIITTLEDRSVATIRSWSQEQFPDLLVGLSLGRDISDRPVVQRLRVRLSELFPSRRIRKSNANLIVAHKSLAKLTVARWAHRRGLPLLVWTVDDSDELNYWLAGNRAWLVTSNYPDRALRIQEQVEGGATDGETKAPSK